MGIKDIALRERIIFALDVDNGADALTFVDLLGDTIGYYKIGLQLFLAEGFDLVERIRERGGKGHKIMLDLKFLDIPQTTGLAMREAAKRGVEMATIHAHVGSVCHAAVAQAGQTKVLGVTVMTSYGETELAELGYPGTIEDLVVARAGIALAAGCGGIVASAREAALLRHTYGDDFVIVTPGIRPASLGSHMGNDDQHRVMTPGRAIAAGADHLVVGRPISRAEKPVEVAQAMLREVEEALG
ncbi:orotidine-5'-phosphate decarboxylase [Fundidesulfovibrio terrae]|uniref:orotidine-5'-phosphate decarboxylase n=1 Tax=Fundidesulfovibrio terrae TaxID=2922866 RepID=UPI001FAECF58|nr:orotidine-5'-phosphate decarboxylase [Fundidesulfovibrio terrae]